MVLVDDLETKIAEEPRYFCVDSLNAGKNAFAFKQEAHAINEVSNYIFWTQVSFPVSELVGEGDCLQESNRTSPT